MHPEDTDKFRTVEELVDRIAQDKKREAEESKGAEISELKPSSTPRTEPEDPKA
jgi:hypothetical protein